MQKNLKNLGIILAAALALSSCSGTGGGSTSTSTGSAPTSSTSVSGSGSGSGEAKAMYPMEGNPKISMVRVLDPSLAQAGLKSYADSAGFQAWQKQTGITVDLKEPADAPALLLLLSSGEIPDVIMGGRTFYPGGVAKLTEDGYARDLNEKADEWAPDYMRHLNSNPVYMNTMKEADGSIRAFGGYSFEEGSPYRAWRGMIIRKEYMDKLGITSISTPEEFYTFLSRCKTELNIALPWASSKDNFKEGSFFAEGVFTSGFGLVNSDEYVKDGVYHHGAYEPEYKDLLTFLNRLYSEKLLDNNFAVTDEATAQSSMIKGETAALYGAASRIQVLTQGANSPDFNLVGISSLVKNKGDKPMYGQADPYISNAYWTYIPETSKNQEAATKFCNYLFTDDGIMLYNYGTEGVSYTIVDGKPKYTELMTNNPNKYSLDAMIRTQGLLNTFGIMKTEMSDQRFPMEEQRAAYAAWSNNDVDTYKILNNSILPEFVNENATLWTDINTYINEMRAKFISGIEPLTNYDQYIATLKKMGMDRLIEIRQKSYDAYNK